jgi:DNA-binding NarL/FixJ family response regulator
VIIADDEALFREGLALLLRAAGMDVVDQARDATEVVVRAEHHRPDIVVMDIRMPPTNTDDGIVAAQELKRRFPGMGVLLLSAHVESASAARLLRDVEGGVGYLLKERVEDISSLCDVMRRIVGGEPVIDGEVVRGLLARQRPAHSLLDQLTDRETAVLALMAEGRTNAGIAHELCLADKTVEANVARIFTRLGLDGSEAAATRSNRRVLAVLAWLRAGGTHQRSP